MFVNRMLWLTACVSLLLVSTSWSHNEVNIEHQDPSSTWDNEVPFNSTGNCMGEDFIACYENILEYVNLGDQAIKISDEKNAVVVIGLTRVGKSTFTQFVANASNPLTIICKGTSCQLIDDSGDGGDSVVSKTFVPNLVEDEITHGELTPFYDMPGFDDTRNISVEIANSFFIQKVIKNIEKIKIVVVAKHASFSSTETTFKNLVTFLMKFAKDPTKFKDSIVLISNFGTTMFDDHAHFMDIRSYLVAYKESMYGDESPHPDPVERERVESWINCFIEAPTENGYDLQNVAVFRTPIGPNATSIRDVPSFQEDLIYMKDLLWNRTAFTPISSDEVGFTLSIEAELFLERATTQSATSIRSALTSFSTNINSHLQNLITSISISPEASELAKVRTHLNILNDLSFGDCNSEAASSPRACIDHLQSQLEAIATDMDDSIFQEVNKTTNFLQFNFEVIRNEKQYDMGEWVSGFHSIYDDLTKFFGAAATNAATAVGSRLDAFAITAHDHYLNGFEVLTTEPIPDDLQTLNQTIGEILRLDFAICKQVNPVSPDACFKEILGKMKKTITATESNLEAELQNSVAFLQFASTILDDSFSLDGWVEGLTSLKSKLEGTLETNNVPGRIFSIVLSQLTQLAQQISSEFLSKIGTYQEIDDLLLYLSGMKRATEAITPKLEGYNSQESLRGYIDLILNAYSQLPINFEISPEGIRQDVILLVESLRVFPWFNSQWINFHRDSLHQPVNLEWTVMAFLDQLFKDLETFQVQAEESGNLHVWRKANANIDATNFDAFWATFKEANINAMINYNDNQNDIKSHIGSMDHSRSWLNILLDYTLLRQNTCPTILSGTASFNGNYMSMRRILDCINAYTIKPTKVIILAENTFFFNSIFDNHGLPENSKFFIMSRSFYITQVSFINLSGTDGGPTDPKPGVPTTPGSSGVAGKKGSDGTDGSDFIGVYLASKGPVTNLDVRSSGGNGQNGQDGGDGSSSSSTSGPNLGSSSGDIMPDSRCSAWSGGDIRMKLYPNDCNSASTMCHAGDNGVWINICGDRPASPGNGGSGGSPGRGGDGGFRVVVNVTDSSPSIQQLPGGSNGSSGKDGARGGQGSWGAIRVRVDDVYSASQKRCKVMEGPHTGYTCFQPLGILQNSTNDGDAVISKNISIPNKARTASYSLAEFRENIEQLVSNARENINIFNRQEMSVFIDFVENNSYLYE